MTLGWDEEPKLLLLCAVVDADVAYAAYAEEQEEEKKRRIHSGEPGPIPSKVDFEQMKRERERTRQKFFPGAPDARPVESN